MSWSSPSLAWLAIQVPTYRHASGEHRQQLKWLYSGAVIFMAALLIGVFIAPLAFGQVPGWGNQAVIGALSTVGTAALPVCLGVAVLKYRLYELDRVISRVVDRRFNRSRYNAEAVVAAFNARLRHTVDLDALQYDLLGVADDAFQPTHVSIWLAPVRAD